MDNQSPRYCWIPPDSSYCANVITGRRSLSCERLRNFLNEVVVGVNFQVVALRCRIWVKESDTKAVRQCRTAHAEAIRAAHDTGTSCEISAIRTQNRNRTRQG